MATTRKRPRRKPAVKKPLPKAGKKVSKAKKKSGSKTKLSPVASRARKLGLESHGYGRWGKAGRITHRTVGGKLVEVKDSKTNRKLTRDGKARAKDALSKLILQGTQKLVKIRMALKKAESRGDDAAVKHLTALLAKSKKEINTSRDRAAKVHGRTRKAA